MPAEEHRHKPERGRSTLLIVREMDGSWTIHGPGATGVTLPADMIALCESILGRRSPARWALSTRDSRSHLLVSEGDQPGALTAARCGHVLPDGTDVDRSPRGPSCDICREFFLFGHNVRQRDD